MAQDREQRIEVTFVVKIFLFSTVISVFIKSLAPYVEISPSAWLAVAIVVAPAMILGIILWQRFLQSKS